MSPRGLLDGQGAGDVMNPRGGGQNFGGWQWFVGCYWVLMFGKCFYFLGSGQCLGVFNSEFNGPGGGAFGMQQFWVGGLEAVGKASLRAMVTWLPFGVYNGMGV